MLYFIKENTIHRYPVSRRCGVVKGNEVLRDTIVHGLEECPYCLRWWPGDAE